MAEQLSASQLGPELQRELEKQPVETQKALLLVHTRFEFDENDLEVFLLNKRVDKLHLDAVPIFEEYLAKQNRRKPNTAVGQSKAAALAAQTVKRKSMLPTALLNGLGVKQEVGEARTPSSKKRKLSEARPVEGVHPPDELMVDGVPATGTPDPPPKPVEVTLKATLNDKLAPPAVEKPASDCEVVLMGDSLLWTSARPGRPYLWMDEPIEYRAALRMSRLSLMEEDLLAAARQACGDEGMPLGVFGAIAPAEVILVGQIVCDGLEGKLNERSIILEGARRGASVHLNVAECPQVAAFPGQVVAVVGRSGMSGDTIHARLFLPGLPLLRAPRAPGTTGLHVVLGAGPYCTRDSLDYSPLDRLLEHAASQRPDVIILLGPFLDDSNLKVKTGETNLPGQDAVLPFEDVYAKHILPRLAKGLTALRRAQPRVRILILPALSEVLCLHPLPQPPLDVGLCMDEQLLKPAMARLSGLGVEMLPNPAHLQLAGLRASLSSADALSPVLRELILRPQGRKIEQAYRLLLQQRTLFPVLPREPARVSEARAAALDFPDGKAPDLCLLPSAAGTPSGLVVDGTVFINPGQVCKATPQTFAEIYVQPGGEGGESVADMTRVDIKKLDF